MAATGRFGPTYGAAQAKYGGGGGGAASAKAIAPSYTPSPALTGGGSVDSVIKQMTGEMESAKMANLQRYEEIMGIHDEIISRYQPGGAFEARGLAEIEKGKVRDVGARKHQLIASGLSGTTTMAGAETGWEADVGAGRRLALQDVMGQRLTSAQQQKAGAIERRTDVGPSYSDLLNLMSRSGQAAGSTAGYQPGGGMNYVGSVDTSGSTSWADWKSQKYTSAFAK